MWAPTEVLVPITSAFVQGNEHHTQLLASLREAFGFKTKSDGPPEEGGWQRLQVKLPTEIICEMEHASNRWFSDVTTAGNVELRIRSDFGRSSVPIQLWGHPVLVLGPSSEACSFVLAALGTSNQSSSSGGRPGAQSSQSWWPNSFLLNESWIRKASQPMCIDSDGRLLFRNWPSCSDGLVGSSELCNETQWEVSDQAASALESDQCLTGGPTPPVGHLKEGKVRQLLPSSWSRGGCSGCFNGKDGVAMRKMLPVVQNGQSSDQAAYLVDPTIDSEGNDLNKMKLHICPGQSVAVSHCNSGGDLHGLTSQGRVQSNNIVLSAGVMYVGPADGSNVDFAGYVKAVQQLLEVGKWPVCGYPLTG